MKTITITNPNGTTSNIIPTPTDLIHIKEREEREKVVNSKSLDLMYEENWNTLVHTPTTLKKFNHVIEPLALKATYATFKMLRLKTGDTITWTRSTNEELFNDWYTLAYTVTLSLFAKYENVYNNRLEKGLHIPLYSIDVYNRIFKLVRKQLNKAYYQNTKKYTNGKLYVTSNLNNNDLEYINNIEDHRIDFDSALNSSVLWEQIVNICEQCNIKDKELQAFKWYIKGYVTEEIANRLHCSKSTALRYYHRVVNVLKARIEY